MHTLYMSLRSPFARKVRVLLEELSVEYKTEVVDVFQPTAAFFAAAPLGRVPVLQTPNGEFLCDRSYIQSYLRDTNLNHVLFQQGGFSRAQVLQASALSNGLMEWTVAVFVETLRAPGLSVAANRAEAIENVQRTLGVLAAHFRGPYYFGQIMRVADIDLAAATAYIDLRLGHAVVDAHPVLRRHIELMGKRPSFQKSVPPA